MIVETLDAYFLARSAEVDQRLEAALPAASCPPAGLHEAMRYALFAGGKRFRPILCLAACDAVCGRRDAVLPFAAALELIHTYSLVHDDLPAMDNDDFRRGKPTTHKVFGEATAILVGDALLTAAFAQIAEAGLSSDFPHKKVLAVIRDLAAAAGSAGMVGGQFSDVASEGKPHLDLEQVYDIHRHKTGDLICSAVRIGGMLGGGSPKELTALTRYGEAVGLAFQIADDLLDVEGQTAETGKSTGADAARGKWTYPRKIGVEAARKEAEAMSERAVSALKPFGPEADRLREIAVLVVRRTK